MVNGLFTEEIFNNPEHITQKQYSVRIVLEQDKHVLIFIIFLLRQMMEKISRLNFLQISKVHSFLSQKIAWLFRDCGNEAVY